MSELAKNEIDEIENPTTKNAITELPNNEMNEIMAIICDYIDNIAPEEIIKNKPTKNTKLNENNRLKRRFYEVPEAVVPELYNNAKLIEGYDNLSIIKIAGKTLEGNTSSYLVMTRIMGKQFITGNLNEPQDVLKFLVESKASMENLTN